jgi:hypothetical protein
VAAPEARSALRLHLANGDPRQKRTKANDETIRARCPRGSGADRGYGGFNLADTKDYEFQLSHSRRGDLRKAHRHGTRQYGLHGSSNRAGQRWGTWCLPVQDEVGDGGPLGFDPWCQDSGRERSGAIQTHRHRTALTRTLVTAAALMVAAAAGEESESNAVKLSPGKLQRTGAKTELVGTRPITQIIKAPGVVAFDETRLSVAYPSSPCASTASLTRSDRLPAART